MPQKINIKSLARDLKEAFPEILFAFLFGSSKTGIAETGSDIDLAVYFSKNTSINNLIPSIMELFDSVAPGIRCDITILNTAGPLIAHEALRGTELFIRDDEMDIYVEYYSLTCRLYEEQIWWMKKQLEYRGYEIQWNY